MRPAQQPPVRVRDFNQAEREKQEQRGNGDCEGDRISNVECRRPNVPRRIRDRSAIFWSLELATSSPSGGGLGAWNFRSRLRLRPVFPAQPEEVEGEEGNEPPVIVLLVITPLGAEMPAANKPERGEGYC